MATVELGKYRNLATTLLVKSGMSEENAKVSANAIIASDRWNIPSHGLMRLPFYLERILAGGINPRAELSVVTDLPSLVIFDGHDGLGHWQLLHAADLAAQRAQDNGIAAVGVGRSSHCGALGIYTWPMINRNLVGIVFSTGPAVMPPWGGKKPLLSTSPIAAGIPTSPPTVIDLATSAVARGKIAAKSQSGEPLEPGWAFTKEGLPTIDAKEALAGMLAPLGGVKGFALATLVESLTGVLIGPRLARDIPDMFASDQASLPQEIAHFVIAIDASKLSVNGESRLQDFAEAVVDSGGRLPGSSRTNPLALNSDDEITVADNVITSINSWTEKLSVL